MIMEVPGSWGNRGYGVRLLAMATVLITLAVPAIGGLGEAARPSDATAAVQDAIGDFNTWIAFLPEQERAGYIQSEDDIATNSVQIDWNGDPTAAGAIVAEGEGRGIHVSVKPTSGPTPISSRLPPLGLPWEQTRDRLPLPRLSTWSLPMGAPRFSM